MVSIDNQLAAGKWWSCDTPRHRLPTMVLTVFGERLTACLHCPAVWGGGGYLAMRAHLLRCNSPTWMLQAQTKRSLVPACSIPREEEGGEQNSSLVSTACHPPVGRAARQCRCALRHRDTQQLESASWKKQQSHWKSGSAVLLEC